MQTLLIILIIILAIAVMLTAVYFDIPEKLLGKSWRTALTGYFTAACWTLYNNPQPLHALPEPWQGMIYGFLQYGVTIGLIGIGHMAKDKQVVGPPDNGSETGLASTIKAIGIIGLAFIAVSFSGCFAIDTASESLNYGYGKAYVGVKLEQHFHAKKPTIRRDFKQLDN